jgi:hypothetical protein
MTAPDPELIQRLLELDERRAPSPKYELAAENRWTFYDDRNSTGRIEIVALGKTVARIFLTKGCEDEDLANAHFIAAAPQMAAQLRALMAERERMRKALKAARQFIRNGVEFGYIVMPDSDTPDTAHNTLPMIEAALSGETT